MSKAFAGMMLEARSVYINKLEGGMSSTLRFPLNESASTDLDRGRVGSGEGEADLVRYERTLSSVTGNLTLRATK